VLFFSSKIWMASAFVMELLISFTHRSLLTTAVRSTPTIRGGKGERLFAGSADFIVVVAVNAALVVVIILVVVVTAAVAVVVAVVLAAAVGIAVDIAVAVASVVNFVDMTLSAVVVQVLVTSVEFIMHFPFASCWNMI